ncbi:hypothetical protein Psta_4436 [Pirellula staleyi DSM 6068]|uniref:Uncharacterized protein n=1 Tax=Pirellula staleyi (strain ATCC 27377 / DSM 6068 / ICPB 4128) TaxID=530564 RepID=D2R5Z6_PIRSD|nr:hypothetical protein [Pirellula staleyi]ADB19081.1 hypothetical protein Psta_4436 [Pirellula staleyi DSM 6068]
MTIDDTCPVYKADDQEHNGASFQISRLVHSRLDASRLLAPIRYWAYLTEMESKGEELEQILSNWDSPSFVELAKRADTILDELDRIWTSGDDGVDMMDLGELRVPLYALTTAIHNRCSQLRADQAKQ